MRTKDELDPRFDRLLPVPSGEDWVDAVVDECLSALPEARRPAAARAAIQRERGTVAVDAGLRMLERIPDLEIAKHVIK